MYFSTRFQLHKLDQPWVILVTVGISYYYPESTGLADYRSRHDLSQNPQEADFFMNVQ